MNEIDPVNLTAELIKCPSVTPKEAGAITLIEDLLNKNGFILKQIPPNYIYISWDLKKIGRAHV